MCVTGLILAGGQARRMNGADKGLVMFQAKPMIEHVIGRFAPQVDDLIINANRNLAFYQQYNYPVEVDLLTGYKGPLAGMLTGLSKCQNEFLCCVPCDSPFLPEDLVERLKAKQKATHAEIVTVSDGQRSHPVFALLKKQLAPSLDDFIRAGHFKIDRWYQQHDYQQIVYPDAAALFENINTPEQLKELESKVGT